MGDNTYNMLYIKQLEAESIHIIREVFAEFEKPVMLYSVGKDSSVMLRLAEKAFYPGKIPFPLLHIDTGFKFKEMYDYRDNYAKKLGVDLIVYKNEEAISKNINPYDFSIQKCCNLLKTKALLDALKKGGYDAAFGGARRDEEKSRAKERIYSFRDKRGQWNPKKQRPELWNLFNGNIEKGETIRVFPISNWTELDIWQYILIENIPIVPLYFARKRKVVFQDGNLIPFDKTVHIENNTTIKTEMCRFRSLGCIPCTGAIKSNAVTLTDIINEMITVKTSERSTRIIDHDIESSMEGKKKEGYF